MFQRLENIMEKMQEAFNTVNTITKDIEEIKNKQTEMNNTITEIKNTLEGTSSRITESEEQISELEDKMVEITAKEENKVKKKKRTEDRLRDSCNSNFGVFDIAPEVSETIPSFFHSFYCILLFRNYFHHFIFQLTD